LSAAGLHVVVPEGWVEVPGASPRELRAGSDDRAGILQISRLGDNMLDYIASHADLGALAGELGMRLGGAARTWGTASATKTGDCALGRFGLAVFPNGQFPSMILWITLAPDEAYMWTWLGPDPRGDEIGAALRVVMEARS